MRLPLLLAAVVAVSASGWSVAAGPLDGTAIQAAPQYYLLNLPDAPIEEVAEAVLGEALGLPFQVDEDIDAQMSFEVAGVYAPKALVEEFANRLWDVETALISKPSSGLWIIPKSELAAEQAEGATLIAPRFAVNAAQRKPAPRPARQARSPGERSFEIRRVDFASLMAGWLVGLATVAGWSHLRHRRRRTTPRLPGPASVASEPASDDLVIPTFPPRTDRATQPER